MFLQAMCGTMLTRIGLRIFPLQKVRGSVRRYLRATSPLPLEKRATANQVVWAAVSAGRHCPIGTTCLATALVAQAMMQHHGYEAKLRIGVRRDGKGAFAAHAWLEREGKVIVGGPAEVVAAYAVMPEMEHLIV